jgi:signal transduction histidine kinase/CheY-like chemotaxis protein/HPt (histidine-containing phosphotransfer) domain-containing protein
METKRYQELKEQYQHASTETAQIDILIDMTLEIRNDNAEKAMLMAEDIIERSETIHYLAGKGNGLNHKGACYWLMGEYEDGLDELTEAFIIAKEIKNKTLEAKVLNNFGRIYRNLGDLDSALRDFEAALEINEALGNELNLTINLTNISNLYYDLGDYDTALEYALKCEPIFEKYKDNSRLVSIYNTLGDIYFKKSLFDEALSYYKKNQALTEEETQGRSLSDSGVGKVYYGLNDFPNAKKYLERALLQAQELDNPEAEIVASFYIGRLYVHQGELDKALGYLESAYELAKDSLRRHDLMSIHEFLSDLYDRMGNIPQAYHHLKAFEKLKEEIFQQATLNKLRNLQIKNQIVVAKKEKEVAEKTAALKQQFMANMSHEIRTPMNAIVGITRLLLERNPQTEQLKYLNVIRQSADNLLVIINDILDLSKIEAGKIVIEQIDFSLHDLIFSIQEIMALKAEQKGLALNVEVDKQIPDRLIGDPTRLNQIFVNLIGNAVKFTDSGFVTLKCDLISKEDDHIKLQFKVLDTGIGISQDYVGRIFESFTQAGTDTARKFGGTGLGLTISKQLVTLMEGEISVESEEGEGTTFTVEIPLIVAQNQDFHPVISSIDNEVMEQLKHISLLLVEDNEFNRLVAEDTLKGLFPDIKLDIAENGQEAVNMVRKNEYDLVLMDVQMPVMNGVDATRTIRTSLPEPKRNIGIIAMTANVLQEDVQQYLDAGMNAFVSKPFQTDVLLLKMSLVLEGKQDRIKKGKEQTTGMGNLQSLPEKVTDMAFLNQFTNGNAEKKKKYIGMFLDNGPKLLAKIKLALAEGDFETVKVAAHSMKPQLSYMGVKEETSNIFLIEQTAGQAAHRDHLLPLIEHLEMLCNQAFAELNVLLTSDL